MLTEFIHKGCFTNDNILFACRVNYLHVSNGACMLVHQIPTDSFMQQNGHLRLLP